MMRSPSYPFFGLNRFSLSEFVITDTELNAIAPAASTGFRKPCSPSIGLSASGVPPDANSGYSIPAATGISATLYAKAQNRF